MPAWPPDTKPVAHDSRAKGGPTFRERIRSLAATAMMTASAVVVGCALAIPLAPLIAWAQTTGSGLTRRPLLTAMIEGGKTIASVQSAQIDFAPAQATGIHRHPIPVVGQVTRGTFRFQLEGEPAHTLAAGSAFFEPADTRVLHFDNASDQEPASIVAFYLMGKDDRELITLTH